ncbi:MAG: hypothetical protein ACLP1X_17200 [Polyangiaceae bacterium]|jgi:hypothetical protein
MNRRIKQGALVAAVVAGLAVMGAGCLTRPVESANPNLKTNFTDVVHNSVIDKIDLLFDIDNSASMGDKQQYLEAAIPDLINGLINPNCVDPTTNAAMGTSTNGSCAAYPGTQVEFPPVHDMHIGIVSSALGQRLGDACLPGAMALAPFNNLLANNDDQAHLLNRSLTYAADLSSATQGMVADASQGFLYWFPMVAANNGAPQGTPVTVAATLNSDFTQMVGGVGVFGCGIESQLETWYRFLVQPDPYDSLTNTGGKANWSGVDQVILQQRHDFLRPDSLVTIIVLSDENDSEIDVRSLGQQGFNWMSSGFSPPRGTSACGNDGVGGNPGDPSCESCAQLSGSAKTSDPNCNPSSANAGVYSTTDVNDWGYDLNLRHVHTKAKYGLDPQFPIQRYLNGLTSPTVPDRNGEYPANSMGQITSSGYMGINDCTNPLFAGALPTGGTDSKTLCQLPPGTRTKDLIFYAHIGGVPHELLHFTPGNSMASALTDADWVKILGNNSIPPNYDYTGIDSHMIESFQARSGIPVCPAAPDGDGVCDWVTNSGAGHILNVDREYACTFPLVGTNGQPTTRDCTLAQNQNFCDCPHMAGTVSPAQLPPICDQTTITNQVGAKAYPTIRELELAHLMGNQGIVSSICPIDVADNAAGDDPLYGYRPAVAVIIDRLKTALTNTCLPEQLTVGSDGSVPCLILVQLPASVGGTCKAPNCQMAGLAGPGQPIAGSGTTTTTFDPTVLDAFCDAEEAAYQQQVQAAGGSSTGIQDPAQQSVCALFQLTQTANNADFQGGSCKGSGQPGWCYVTGVAAGTCPQAILFTGSEPPSGATVNLQCLEQSVGVLDSGTAAAMATAPSSSGSTGGGSTSSSGSASSSGGDDASGVTTGGD